MSEKAALPVLLSMRRAQLIIVWSLPVEGAQADAFKPLASPIALREAFRCRGTERLTHMRVSRCVTHTHTHRSQE